MQGVEHRYVQMTGQEVRYDDLTDEMCSRQLEPIRSHGGSRHAPQVVLTRQQWDVDLYYSVGTSGQTLELMGAVEFNYTAAPYWMREYPHRAHLPPVKPDVHWGEGIVGDGDDNLAHAFAVEVTVVTHPPVVSRRAQSHLPCDPVHDAGHPQVVLRQVAVEGDVDHGQDLQ
ncbi:hypothetical protein D3C81_1651260 [compost metagenome]